jgi:acyl carrier protein
MSSETATSSQVRELVRELAPYPVETIDETSRLELDLRYDSLALVELAVEIEARFGLPPMAETELMDIETVGDIERLVGG